MGLLDGLSDYANAIATVESGGKYDILGPRVSSGDRAYGKYQVMGANIPEWTRAALGKELTPQEFLASPEAQDAVFNHRFGGYVQKYGNPQDAASMWFSGRPLSMAGNSSDGYNTVPQYVAKFNNALGSPAQQRASVTSSQVPAAPYQAPSQQAQTAELPPMFGAAPKPQVAITTVPTDQPAPRSYFDLLAATLAEGQRVKPIKFAGLPARRGFY